MLDAICLVSNHLQVDIIWLSVCKSIVVFNFFLTNTYFILHLLLLIRLNLSCYLLNSFNDCQISFC